MTLNRKRVFISYSRSDKEWLDRIHVHLRPLIRSGAIDLWDDTKVVPGSKWKETLKEQLDSAGIALFLVSADFLASDFIDTEELSPLLKAAERDGTQLLSIILSPCSFAGSPLSDYQSINSPSLPLIKLLKSEQEEIFNALASFINGLGLQDSESSSLRYNNQTQRLQSAELMIVTGSFEKAEQEASLVLQTNPNNVDALLIRARANSFIYNKEEDVLCDTAQALLLLRGKNDAFSLQNYAQALSILNNSHLAIGYINKSIDIDSSNLKARSLRLRIYLQCGKYSDSIKEADWLLNINVNDGAAWFRKGLANYYLKNYDEAIRCINISLRHIPDFWIIYEFQGQSYNQLGMIDEALNSFSTLLEKAPWYNETRKFKSALLTDLKRYPEALSEVSLALIFAPNDSLLLSMQAEIYLNLKDYNNAKKSAEAALRLNSEDYVALEVIEKLRTADI